MKTVQVKIPDWLDEKVVKVLVESMIVKKRISVEEFISLLRSLPKPKYREFKWKEIKKEYYEGKLRS